MTTKRHKFLSPPGKTIDILTSGGGAITPNMNACHYALPNHEAAENVFVFLAAAGDDAADDDLDVNINLILLLKR